MTKQPGKKFRVNKTQKYNDNKRSQNKKDNIFLLTRDNYYFILEKKYVKKSDFFQNLFRVDSSAGHLRNPIFLQKTMSTHFKYVIQYLKHYEGITEEDFEISDIITINDLYANYQNDWDKTFIREIEREYKNKPEKFEELLKTIHYMGVDNLYKKVKYCYDFLENMKVYKLDDIEYELNHLSNELSEDLSSEDFEA